MYGLQYALTPNDMIDVTYLGNHGVKLPFNYAEVNQLPAQDLAQGDALLAKVANPFYGHITASGCGLAGATVPAFRLLMPYPEFCSVHNDNPPGSFSTYNAAEITFRHRWAQGLQLGVSYTISKYIDNSAGVGEWANVGYGPPIRNWYDLSAEKSLDANDIPQSLVVNYVYQLPVGHGKHFATNLHGIGDAVLGGWQVSGITTAKEGFPLQIITSNVTMGGFNMGVHPDIVGDPHLSNPTINEWFNTSAFVSPQPFKFGDAPRYMPNLRAPGIRNWDLGIEKWWHWQERLRVQFRGEFYDAFNNVNLFAPNQFLGGPGSGFGTITSAMRPRDIQFALKIYW
jgi:hypothetical protein